MIEILRNEKNRVIYELDENVEKKCRKLLHRKKYVADCLAKAYREKITQNNLVRSTALYQKEWGKINDIFFEYLEKITGYKSNYDCYYCVVDPCIYAVADWGGNEIMLGMNQPSCIFSKIAAYEITVSYVFNILNREKKELTDEQKWAISECFSGILLNQDKVKNKLWKKTEKIKKRNFYPELDRLKQEINQQIGNKKNFKTLLNFICENIEKFYVSSKRG